MKDREKALSALTREAREHWKPAPLREGDEERLLERISSDSDERGARGNVVPLRLSSRVAVGIAAAVAVAAAALLFTRSDETASNVMPSATHHHAVHGNADTSRLASVQGGEVLIDGTLAEPAAVLPEGSEVLARGADAVFKAGDRVRWVLEAGSLVSVDRSGDTGGTIVLALRSGAVEAQVTPVPNGEAFAVDVAGVRVAVHGTHLRVARLAGSDGVAVDLNEGMISIGRPPKVGSTYGTTVTAPAHVEFSPNDLDGTIEIDHAPASVRPPNGLLADEAVAAPVPPSEVAPPKTPESSAAEARPNPSAPPPAIAPKVLGPVDAVQAAVRSCADQSLKKGAVPTTVQSTLTVEVRTDGTASSASFEPPLPPDLQQCVAHTVYAAHWSEPGPHRIPIELRF